MSAVGPIGEVAYRAAVAAFFALAFTFAAARTIIRGYMFRRVFADDGFLFLAIVTLIASTGLFYSTIPLQYSLAGAAAGLEPLPADFLGWVTKTANIAYAAEALAWSTIFAVKFSFLFYFHGLIRRLRGLNILWWCTLAVFIPITATSISAPFIVCPYVGPSVIANCLNDGFFQRENVMLYYGIAADILTDLMLISIPVVLLWKTQFKLRQKLSIGILLCLSLVMIAIAMVRGISARYYGTNAQIWTSFWVEIESCVSVSMVCMTAFRTLFVVPSGSKKTPPVHYNKRTSKGKPQSRKQGHVLPDISTGATMTGMRTIIEANGRTALGSLDSDEHSWPIKSHGSLRPSHDGSILVASHKHASSTASWV